MSLEDTCKTIINKLSLIDKKCRPKSEETLKNYIKSQLGLKQLSPIVNDIYQKLLDSKKIYFNQAKKIEYAF
jgi:hypothetical protein